VRKKSKTVAPAPYIDINSSADQGSSTTAASERRAVSAADSSAWADRLRLVLADRDVESPREELLYVGEDDWLTAALDGLREPTIAQYARLAAHAGVPLTVLTGAASPARSLAVALRAGLIEAPADVTAEVERAHQLIDASRLLMSWFPARSAELASAAAIAHRARASLHFKMEAGQQAAENLRALWDLDDDQPVGDLAALVEGLGVPVESRVLPEGVHGMTVHDEADARWSALVFVSTRDWWTRQRYSLAHELCHVLYRDTQQVIVDRNEEDSTDLHEVRAEAFARHLLLPDTAVRASLSRGHESDAALVAEIMLSYGVSRTATLKALKAIAGWSEERLASIGSGSLSVTELMSQVHRRDEWQAASADQSEPTASGLLLEMSLHAYREQLVPAETVATVLDRSPSEVVNELTAQGWSPTSQLS
jgi:hypothetical protein